MEVCYPVIKLGCTVTMNVFFKDLNMIGIENIPKKGPVIICGNHTNQFLDAGLMLSSVPRPVSFIVAAKSYRKYLVGTLAKCLRAIPVERPQDIAKEGTGRITQIKEDILVGLYTRFTEEVQPGDVLKVKDVAVDVVVKEVLSNTELSYVAEKDITQQGIKYTFKIYPKLDQTEVYDSVWQKLMKGGCVGIFPEGGSHDRTELLPLKAGVCIMALGAMAKNSKPVKIVPCGFNYFKGYKFRSKAIVEFGVPFEVPKSMLDLYLKSKKDGISALLTEIEKRLKAVTITSPTYKELSSVYLARKLYVPANYSLTPHEEHMLNQTLAEGYNELKENSEVKNLFESVRRYHSDLRKLRLEDSAVKRISSKKWKNIGRSLLSILILIANGTFVLPGLAFNGPIGLIIKLLSERERRKALKDSNVKAKGTDVMGSIKVLYSVVAFPVAALLLTLVFRFLLKHLFKANKSNQNKFTVLFLIFWALYSYLTVLASDSTVKHYRSLKARFNMLMYKEKMERLRETRKDLQKRVTDFVNNHLNMPEDSNAQPIERIRKYSEENNIGK